MITATSLKIFAQIKCLNSTEEFFLNFLALLLMERKVAFSGSKYIYLSFRKSLGTNLLKYKRQKYQKINIELVKFLNMKLIQLYSVQE